MITKWYKATWDGTINPLYVIAHFPQKEKINYGRARKLCVWIFSGDNFLLAYDTNDMLQLGEYVIKNILDTRLSLQTIVRGYNYHAQNLEKYFSYIEEADLKNLPNKKLSSLLGKLLEDYMEQFGWSAICEPLGLYLQEGITKELKRIGKVDWQNIIFSPTHLSFLQCQELDLLKIIDNDYKGLKEHRDKYFWIQNNYAGAQTLTTEYFLEEAQELAKKLGREDKIRAKIKELENLTDNVARKKKAILEKVKEPLKSYIKILDFSISFWDERKIIAIKAMTFLDQLNQEIARRLRLKLDEVKFLIPDEIRDALVKNQKPNMEEIHRRMESCLILWQDDKITFSTDKKEIKKWQKALLGGKTETSILRGTPASSGKVNGKVRVLFSSKEIHKIKEGEILVATNTTPEYVPAMKKAIAILTEKGGMTSHAAIVSRELKVPCIVGISNITEILKTGDLAEVDANNGVVRKLK